MQVIGIIFYEKKNKMIKMQFINKSKIHFTIEKNSHFKN